MSNIKISHLGLPVALKHNRQRRKINQRENVLRPLNILPLVCKAVQLLVYPDMRAGIYERSCATDDLLVISLSFQVNLNLLHIRRPVNFCVCQCVSCEGATRVLVMARTSNFVNDDAAERCVCHQEQGRYPFRVTRVIGNVEGLAEERHGAGSFAVLTSGLAEML